MPNRPKRPDRWCWPCLISGVALFGYATVAVAQAVTQPVFQINVYALVAGLLGLLLAMGGAFMRGLYGRVERTETGIAGLAAALAAHQLATAQNHPTKSDSDRQHQELMGQINALHSRFDKAHLPSAFPHN